MVLRRLTMTALLLLGTICLSCFIPMAAAQVGQVEITGEVRDPSGGVVPSAKVTVTENRTNQAYTTVTGPGGVYTFNYLKPGIYKIGVEAPGFKHFTRDGLQVSTGERIRLDIDLVIGSESESITVTADTPLLRTGSGSLGQVIGNRKIVDLPLNGRSFIPLVSLSSGVALPPGSSFPRINGGRPRTN
jgi:hypothetical protein